MGEITRRREEIRNLPPTVSTKFSILEIPVPLSRSQKGTSERRDKKSVSPKRQRLGEEGFYRAYKKPVNPKKDGKTNRRKKSI